MLSKPAIADAPANHRIRIVLRSYTVPKISPRYWWAMNASARPFAFPPSVEAPTAVCSAEHAQNSGGACETAAAPQSTLGQNSSRGIKTLVIKLLAISIKLIMNAAVINSLRVLAIRFGRLTSGITETPVSKPERPSASLGKLVIESKMIAAYPVN